MKRYRLQAVPNGDEREVVVITDAVNLTVGFGKDELKVEAVRNDEGEWLRFKDCELIVEIIGTLPKCGCGLLALHKTELNYFCDEHVQFSDYALYPSEQLPYAPLLRKLAAS
jgi:hypothetical protein